MSTVHLAAILAVGLAALAASPASAMPSDHVFDCDQARSPTEKTICAHPNLKQTDDRIAITYHVLMNDIAEPAIGWRAKIGLRFSQRQYLRYRNACGRNTGCLDEVMGRRSARIENYR